MQSDPRLSDLVGEIAAIPVVDTHEHLPIGPSQVNPEADLLREYLIHYFVRDLISSGLPEPVLARALDASLPVADRYGLLSSHWEFCRLTGYGQALDRAVRILYGFPRLDGDTVEGIAAAFRASNRPDKLHRVLRDACGIVTSLLCHPQSLESDRSLYTPVFDIGPLVWITGRPSLDALEAAWNVRIDGFSDLLAAVDGILDRVEAMGVRIFKNGLAYARPLLFPETGREEAERAYPGFGPALHDYLMHHVLRRIDRDGVVLQIHTGLQEGNGNDLRYTHPEHLLNQFHLYRNLKFDIFHMGYPYQDSLAALVKMFPNVYLDLCWTHIITPRLTRRFLAETLESVPANKISAFGGDYCFADGVPGHLDIARENLGKVLLDKMDDGLLDRKGALSLARRLLFDNPAELFRLEFGPDGRVRT